MICFHCIPKIYIKIKILTLFKTIHYFIILILFRMINLDNTNYVTIGDNVVIMLIMLKQWRTVRNICYTNVYSERSTKVENVYRRVKLIIIKLFA